MILKHVFGPQIEELIFYKKWTGPFFTKWSILHKMGVIWTTFSKYGPVHIPKKIGGPYIFQIFFYMTK